MTRISDLGLQQTLLSGFQRAQDAAQTRQIQLSSGKVSENYGGIGPQTNRLLSAEGLIARTSAYEGAANAALSRLQVQEASVTSVGEAAADLRESLVAALANGTGDGVDLALETNAQRVLASLNAEFGGVFVFGGTDGTARPVAGSTLSDVAGAASTDDLFTEGERTTLAVEAGVSVDGGPLAAEIGSALVAELGALANLGDISGELTAAERDFLSMSVRSLEAISNDLIVELGVNGVAQSQAQAAIDRNSRLRDEAEVLAAQIEDADLAEVVARLNQDQLAIQASAEALSQATQLSLLNFL